MPWPRFTFRQYIAAARRRADHGRAFADWFWAAGHRLDAEARRDSRGIHQAVERMKAALTRRLKIEAGLA